MTNQADLSDELIRNFVIAGHGNLENVQALLAEHPALLNAAYPWQPDDHETAIQGAAHVGNRAIVEYLLAQGAPLEICTAAMLGRRDAVEDLVRSDPTLVHSVGPHRIALLTHAAISGNVDLVAWLVQAGASEGMAAALHNAASRGHGDLVRWLLDNSDPDLTWRNFQGKTALEAATARGQDDIAQLLRERGAAPANTGTEG
jgi:ankyrin repeat protein